ncbi:MAG TPA: nickel-dependent hydrogenase large subunit [Coriobacteriia bacterium]|nr:nickel-dependent hydrogenase large subunit [Coriobacteriia bacterium]
MAENIVIDPVTRIEGHLRVEVTVDNGVITDAWASEGLFRGMETVMQGREPSDAFYIAQRICGVCPISHGHASTMSAESALGVKIPNGARIVRNIIESAEFLHSHVLWFYTLAALDYVDPAKALTADIAQTYALAEAAGTSSSNFGAVQKKLQALVDSGQLSIFTNGWLGHPAFAQDMPAELHLIAVAHYLEALDIQAEASRIIAIMGGKFPHFMTSIPGGTAWVPTEEKLDDVLFRLQKVRDWVHATMIPDTLAIAPFYKDALTYGGGHGNFLAWGVFNDESMDMEKRFLPSGVVYAKKGLSVEKADPAKIAEYVDHSWLSAGPNGKHPSEGDTVPPTKFAGYDLSKEYSWGKAPRYDGNPMEVGPLARMIVAYLKGVAPVKTIVDLALEKLGAPGKPEVLVSLLGRIAARNLETAVVADMALDEVMGLIAAIKGGDALSFFTPLEASEGKGAGLWEAPRGALGHWMNVSGGKITNYQVCTPSTWDMSPRDDKGVRGPLEEALIGVPVMDVERPIEAARIARSFDP